VTEGDVMEMEKCAMGRERSVQCHPDEETLSALLDGEVSPAEFVDILRHLSYCDSCRRDAGQFWGAFSALSGLLPNLADQTGECPGDLRPLEDAVVSMLSDLIPVHWTLAIPGVRLSRAKALELQAGIKLRVRRTARAKLAGLERHLFKSFPLGSGPDVSQPRPERRQGSRWTLVGRSLYRALPQLKKPVRAVRSLGRATIRLTLHLGSLINGVPGLT